MVLSDGNGLAWHGTAFVANWDITYQNFFVKTAVEFILSLHHVSKGQIHHSSSNHLLPQWSCHPDQKPFFLGWRTSAKDKRPRSKLPREEVVSEGVALTVWANGCKRNYIKNKIMLSDLVLGAQHISPPFASTIPLPEPLSTSILHCTVQSPPKWMQ